MKITIEPGCFADEDAELLCRRRLGLVLARYGDLVRSLTVARNAGGLRVEVSFGLGVGLTVEPAEVEGADAILHLADRVGRAVARRADLRTNPAAASLFEAKPSK